MKQFLTSLFLLHCQTPNYQGLFLLKTRRWIPKNERI